MAWPHDWESVVYIPSTEGLPQRCNPSGRNGTERRGTTAQRNDRLHEKGSPRIIPLVSISCDARVLFPMGNRSFSHPGDVIDRYPKGEASDVNVPVV